MTKWFLICHLYGFVVAYLGFYPQPCLSGGLFTSILSKTVDTKVHRSLVYSHHGHAYFTIKLLTPNNDAQSQTEA